MRDEKISEITQKVGEALKIAKLTPFGVEETVKEIKKMIKIIAGVFTVAVLLFLLLYDTKIHDDFYDLGVIAAIFLGIADLVCFVVVIAIIVIICQEWREVRRSENKSSEGEELK
jgi:uncharacterized membrane protein